MSRHRDLLRTVALSIAVAVAVAGPGLPAAAHDPTPNRPGPGYDSTDTLQRVWSTTYEPTSWMKSAVDLAISNAPASGADIPQFDASTGINGYIYYRARSGSACEDLPTAWACADNNIGTGNTWRITFIQQGQACGGSCNVTWCEYFSPDHNSDCIRSKRAAIHELGHVLDLDHYGSDHEDWTVMFGTSPEAQQAGGDSASYKTCDRARLLIKHGANTPSSNYSACLDHLDNAVPGVGLKSTVTLAISDESPCRYQSVVFSGTVKTADITSYPDTLQNKPLQGREVRVQYRPYGSSGSWSLFGTDTSSSSTGYWSVTDLFTTVASFEFRARFIGDEGLDEDYSAVHTLQVLPC